jgi:hypothetical protein
MDFLLGLLVAVAATAVLLATGITAAGFLVAILWCVRWVIRGVNRIRNGRKNGT